MFMSIAFNEAWVPNNARAVTPSDTTVLNCVALYVGAAGNVVVDTEDNANITFANVPSGTVLWLKAVRVKAATTATNIVALF
jgi:hypothetical protein